MFAILFAVCVMVWLWAAAMRHAVLAWAANASPAQQRVYVGMAVVAGGGLIAFLVFRFLPLSVLSAGWSSEQLEGLTRGAVLSVTVVSLLALWRAHLLLPGNFDVRQKSSPGKGPVNPASPKKRRS